MNKLIAPLNDQSLTEINSRLQSLFCNVPFSLVFTTSRNTRKANISYQDFLTEPHLFDLLSRLPYDIQWTINRNMSRRTEMMLLEELFMSPEKLKQDPSLCGNVRWYVFDRFCNTDF